MTVQAPNRHLGLWLVLSVLILAGLPDAHAQESNATSSLKVAEAVLATSVENLTPKGVSDRFPADVGRVFAFTRIQGARGETFVKHLWYHEDRLMAEVELAVRSPNWRTYSSKRITPHMKGNWRVDITDPEGTVLESLTFVVE